MPGKITHLTGADAKKKKKEHRNQAPVNSMKSNHGELGKTVDSIKEARRKQLKALKDL